MARRMTFKEYISKRRVTDTPAGDFTADARSDRNFPDDVKSWEQVKSYISSKSRHDKDVLAAAREVWRGYQRALK
jgi:uncharacterized protein YozE (UPF0346 family)